MRNRIKRDYNAKGPSVTGGTVAMFDIGSDSGGVRQPVEDDRAV